MQERTSNDTERFYINMTWALQLPRLHIVPASSKHFSLLLNDLNVLLVAKTVSSKHR